MNALNTHLHTTAKPEREPVAEELHPIASLVCLLGVFMHIILSPTLLETIGIQYAGDGGSPLEKLHPGTFLIVLSFFMLLFSSGNPIAMMGRIFAKHSIFAGFLLLCLSILFYLIMRSGPMGFAFFIDTHICPVLCAIVLSYCPTHYCRRAIYCFIAIAFVNSLIAVAENIGRFHILHIERQDDTLFRSTALLGHPLENALFTSFVLFIILAVPFSNKLKCLLVVALMTALVAYGGRAALFFAVAGVGYFGISYLFRVMNSKQMTLPQIFLLISGLLVIPVLFVGGLYLVINSSIGERMLSSADLSDSSANARLLAIKVFNFMTREEIIFGVSSGRIVEIAYRMNLIIPLADIENPWILLIMFMGVIVFPFWLIGTGFFVGRLMKGNPLALQLGTISYFVIASTSNSFGRKDSMYLIMVSAIICAGRFLKSLDSDTVKNAHIA